MSTPIDPINALNTLNTSIQKLHEENSDLSFEVERIIKAKDTLGLTWEVKEECGQSLTTVLASATNVAAGVRIVLAAYDTP
jgi:hypothetical protein